MKRTTFNLLAAMFLWLGCCFIATAQNVAQSDQFTQGQQIIQDDSTSTGQFQSVSVDPSSSSLLTLRPAMSGFWVVIAVMPRPLRIQYTGAR